MEPIRQIIERLGGEMSTVLSSTISRLVIAAVLGGIIGLERELHHKPAGLRTNMFICFGAAMFTILSDQLAMEHPGDHTRIAAPIIPGIGICRVIIIVDSSRDEHDVLKLLPEESNVFSSAATLGATEHE